MKSGVIVVFDKVKKVADSMRALVENQVLVGVPQEKAPRKSEPITNAQLGYIHENGAPEANIPARPHLVPGVKNSKNEWEPRLLDATKASFEGNQNRVINNLNAAGLLAVSAVRLRIQSNIPPPLSQSTIDNRKRRTKNKGNLFTALIDTGNFIKSFTYVLRKGK